MKIESLLDAPKELGKAHQKRKSHAEHEELDFDVTSPVAGRFIVFVRVPVVLVESFSIGLRWVGDDGGAVLLRLNGDHGTHGNPDGTKVADVAHLHAPTAQERAGDLVAGYEPRFATALTGCSTLPEAWERFCLEAKLAPGSKAGHIITRLHEQGAQTDLMELLP